MATVLARGGPWIVERVLTALMVGAFLAVLLLVAWGM